MGLRPKQDADQRAKIEAAESVGISAHDAVRENPQVEPIGEAAQIRR